MGNKDENAARKGKVLILAVKIELNIKWVLEEKAIYANIASVWAILDMHLGELSEGKLSDTNEESDFDKKGEDALEEGDTSDNLHIKGTFLDISQHWKCKG